MKNEKLYTQKFETQHVGQSYIHKTKMKGVTFNYFGRHQCLKKEASSLKCNHACFT